LSTTCKITRGGLWRKGRLFFWGDETCHQSLKSCTSITENIELPVHERAWAAEYRHCLTEKADGSAYGLAPAGLPPGGSMLRGWRRLSNPADRMFRGFESVARRCLIKGGPGGAGNG